MAVGHDPIEGHFAVRGPHAVTVDSVPGSHNGLGYEIYRPSDLGHDILCPIVTWGNGTLAQPHHYPGVLEQLASWGMVVVASMSKRTGRGAEMAEGIRYLHRQHEAPESPYHGALKLDRVGAAGHSQGAGGTVNVATKQNCSVAAAVPICLPNTRWVGRGDEYDVSALRCPALFLGGSRDRVIAGPRTLRGFFERTPAPAGVASLIGAGHNVIQKSGGRYLGYLTAWLRWHLCDDQEAAAAFTGDDPEFLRNRAWILRSARR